MSRDLRLYVADILQNMRDAQEFVAGMSYAEFIRDKRTVNAVVRSFEVIGEAAKHVPEALRDKYPSIQWREMAGMRDKVIHQYFAVDHEIVWLSVTESIPAMIPLLQSMLAEMDSRAQRQ